MAKLDDLEFRITASTDLLRTQVAQGSQVVQKFADDTGRSFNQLHNRFTEVAGKLRGLFGLFGIGFGARVFEGWIAGAIQVNKLTDDQAQKLQGVRTEFAAMKNATDELAQAIAIRLSPYLQRASQFWREFLFPSAGEVADSRIREIDAQIQALSRLNSAQLASKSFQTPHGGGIGGLWDWITGATDSSSFTERVDATIAKIKELEAERTKLSKTRDSESDTALDQYRNELGVLKEIAAERAGLDKDAVAQMERELQLQKDLNAEALAPKGGLDVESQVLNEALVEQMTRFSDTKLPDFKFPEINLEDFKSGLDEMQKETHKFANEFGQGLHNSLVSFILDGQHRFSDFLKQLAAEVAVSGLFNLLSGGLSGSTSGVGKFFADVFGGGRASGGPVSAGVPYLVGERGPELFMPNVSGSISPNSGGRTIQVNQHFHLDSGLAPILEAQASTIVRISASAAYDAVMQTLSGVR